MATKLYEQDEQTEGLDPALLTGGGDTRLHGDGRRGSGGADSDRHTDVDAPMVSEDEESEGRESDSADDAAIAPEPRKRVNSTTLLMFVLLAIGGAGTYFMYVTTGASQAAPVDRATASAQTTIQQFLSDGPSNVKQMKSMLDSTRKVVDQFRWYPSATQIPLSSLKTNPFHYANANPAVPPDVALKQREAERAAALKAASALRLQSIIHSDTQKSCMINNSLYSEGAQFNGFIIERIETSGVIVRYGIYRFELTMKK